MRVHINNKIYIYTIYTWNVCVRCSQNEKNKKLRTKKSGNATCKIDSKARVDRMF